MVYTPALGRTGRRFASHGECADGTTGEKTVWQWLCWAGDRYFIKAMSSMALGLFASLIIGLILSQLAQVSFLAWLQPYADMVASSSPVVGSAIGVAVASGLKAKPLVVFTSAVTAPSATTWAARWARSWRRWSARSWGTWWPGARPWTSCWCRL